MKGVGACLEGLDVPKLDDSQTLPFLVGDISCGCRFHTLGLLLQDGCSGQRPSV